MSARAIEGRVRGLAKEGDAVVETPSGLVFAPGGLPGERVRLEDVRKEGKILRARQLIVLEASPERVEAPCAYVERCGGCPWMHASSSAQSDAKRAMVERALAKVPRRSDVSIPITDAETTLGYRRRARLAWKRTGQGVVIGFRGRRRERIEDIEHCIVLRPELDAALSVLRARVVPHLPGSGELQLAIGEGGRAVIAIDTPDAPPRAMFEALEALVAEGVIAGASARVGGTTVATQMGDPREVGADVEGRRIVGESGGFSQAHAEINAALGVRALELAEAEGARVLELYAGHGNLTLGLAVRAAAVRAVEIAPGATRALKENLIAHGLGEHAEVITSDAASAIGKKSGAWDVVLLDPPRTGAKDAIAAIVSTKAERIVYVSCDPATLARDLETLGAAGYQLDAAECFDMFPQTSHVETIARMRRP